MSNFWSLWHAAVAAVGVVALFDGVRRRRPVLIAGGVGCLVGTALVLTAS